MPTAAKLFGAVTFAALCWFVSGFIPPLLPGNTPTPLLQPVNAGVGFIMGWTILGRNAGTGLIATIGHASTTAVASVFWCLLIWSGSEMIDKSMKLRYNGPIEALQDMASMAAGYASMIATVEIIGALVLGVIVTAIMTESAASRWA